ncbi:MAG: hypothetical protein ACRC8B_02905, partial [Aeromonas sobria]|uniref:hypothetical protein n=1 Tax=Aeromonas sobria TaxID=646 RepID=UPI003F390B0F
QGSKPADFWQIGRILLKKSGNSTSFLRLNASKFNKKATLPIIYALTTFATPIGERKEKTTIKRDCQTLNNNKVRIISS